LAGRDQSVDVERLGALAAWRPTQGIYRCDADLYAALAASPVYRALPSERLHQRPPRFVYSEAP
jgi:hypothetical protein